MKCVVVSDRIQDLANQSVTDREWVEYMAHVDTCPDCRAALRGAEALVELRRRDSVAQPDGLFDHVVATATAAARAGDGRRRFWIGTGFGGVIAASLFAMALALGWLDGFREDLSANAEFVVALSEPRTMNLAFEVDRPLEGATISILLTGDVGIAGYGAQHELKWTEDLAAGVNRLTLPLLATGMDGGRMVVHLSHPQSEQVFVIDLRTES